MTITIEKTATGLAPGRRGGDRNGNRLRRRATKGQGMTKKQFREAAFVVLMMAAMVAALYAGRGYGLPDGVMRVERPASDARVHP
jgi:hypothetical protein